MTAKAYIDGLTYQEFEKVRALRESPNFFQFLAEPSDDAVTVASFAMQCKDSGVPEELTRSAESLHYLVIAINNRLGGNA